jgi:hypothetical protein
MPSVGLQQIKSRGLVPYMSDVGEAIMPLLGKDLLRTAGDSAKTACGSKQLCAGLEAWVEAGIHAARSSWGEEGWSADHAPDPNDPFAQ